MADRGLTRRGSLIRFGGLLAAVVGVDGWKVAASEGAGPAGVATGALTCVLAPELTEGPYYIPNEKVRRNITEGRQGTPLALYLTVIDASTCRPIKGASVDVWHADAGGLYSGESVQNTVGETFMRGIQRTNAHGLAILQTVYPGWYTGRTVHIHVKVHVAGNVVHLVDLQRHQSVRSDDLARQYPRADDDLGNVGGPDGWQRPRDRRRGRLVGQHCDRRRELQQGERDRRLDQQLEQRLGRQQQAEGDLHVLLPARRRRDLRGQLVERQDRNIANLPELDALRRRDLRRRLRRLPLEHARLGDQRRVSGRERHRWLRPRRTEHLQRPAREQQRDRRRADLLHGQRQPGKQRLPQRSPGRPARDQRGAGNTITNDSFSGDSGLGIASAGFYYNVCAGGINQPFSPVEAPMGSNNTFSNLCFSRTNIPGLASNCKS